MLALSKVVHVLALGVWFGAVVFFSLAGVLIFRAFEEQSQADPRPAWLPLPAAYDREPPSAKFPRPLRLEQGSRLAGVAVSRVFPAFYGLQAGCALLAAATALLWWRDGAVHRVRAVVLLLGLGTVALGWWLEHVVTELRGPRNAATDAVLLAGAPTAEQVGTAEEARATFGRWHGYSLLVNFLTLALAGVGMALAAWLPAAGVRGQESGVRRTEEDPSLALRVASSPPVSSLPSSPLTPGP